MDMSRLLLLVLSVLMEHLGVVMMMSEVSCCVEHLKNGSAIYRPTGVPQNCTITWSKDGSSIVDEHRAMHGHYVITVGGNQEVTLKLNYLGISFRMECNQGAEEVTCTDNCEDGDADLPKVDSNSGSAGDTKTVDASSDARLMDGLVPTIIIIIISSVCVFFYWKFCRKRANANSGNCVKAANSANDTKGANDANGAKDATSANGSELEPLNHQESAM